MTERKARTHLVCRDAVRGHDLLDQRGFTGVLLPSRNRYGSPVPLRYPVGLSAVTRQMFAIGLSS